MTSPSATPSGTWSSRSPSRASIVGWMSVWADQIELSTLRFATPGPARPSQGVLIDGATSPWFHASWPLGSLAHELPQLDDPLLRQRSGLANSASVAGHLRSPWPHDQ